MTMGIERDLHDLLYCHDCVIVPQWGGFLTHYRSARLDEARKLLHPPGKDVSFNRHLVRNDGLLADHLARRTGLGFEAATARVEAEVTGWRSTLERSGRLELPHIGIFYRDAEQNLQFDPDKRSNFLKDAYGLRPLVAMPRLRIRKAPAVDMPAPGATVRDLQPHGTPRKHSAMLWAAAAVSAVLFGAAAVWALRSGVDQAVQWSSFELPWTGPERSHVPPPEGGITPVASASILTLPTELLGVRTLPLSAGDSVHITVDLGSPEVAEAEPDKTAVVNAAPAKQVVAQGIARFHVVGGCFADPANAERFHAELLAKGYPALRLERYGELHPVVFGSYARREEALEALALVRAGSASSAWLLVR